MEKNLSEKLESGVLAGLTGVMLSAVVYDLVVDNQLPIYPQMPQIVHYVEMQEANLDLITKMRSNLGDIRSEEISSYEQSLNEKLFLVEREIEKLTSYTGIVEIRKQFEEEVRIVKEKRSQKINSSLLGVSLYALPGFGIGFVGGFFGPSLITRRKKKLEERK